VNGEVRFCNDENGLPYIDLEGSPEDASALMVQTGTKEVSNLFVQMV
jgi:hypothetical protein